jgi:hypothetical protein
LLAGTTVPEAIDATPGTLPLISIRLAPRIEHARPARILLDRWPR